MDNKHSENPLMDALSNSMLEVKRKSAEHEILRNTEEYKLELEFLRRTKYTRLESVKLPPLDGKILEKNIFFHATLMTSLRLL